MAGPDPSLEEVFGYIPPSWNLAPPKSEEDAARAAYEKLNPKKPKDEPVGGKYDGKN